MYRRKFIMKKRIIALTAALALIASFAFTAHAATPEIIYESSYDADTNLVAVDIYVKNALGTESADLSLAFDSEMFEYDSNTEYSDSEAMIISGLVPGDNGLCTCSFVFSESCAESDLDENGNLQLVQFKFKPLGEDFDINDFTLWATSYDIKDVGSILNSIKMQGDEKKRAEHTMQVTTKNNANNADGNNANADGNDGVSDSSSSESSKWYIYVVSGVLAVAAIAGIALIAVKSGKGEDEDDEDSDDKDDKTEKTVETEKANEPEESVENTGNDETIENIKNNENESKPTVQDGSNADTDNKTK